MNIDHYRNFVAIIDEGSMSAAAQKLHIAQPALSNQLKALEKEFGTALMRREGRHLFPTEAGLILYEKAKNIYEQEQTAQKQIQACILGTQGTLRIGITHILPDPFITDLLSKFCASYPGICFDLFEHNSGVLLEMLKNNEIDVAIVNGSMSIPSNIHTSRAMVANTIAIFPRQNPWLSSELSEIPVALLKGVPLAYSRGLDQRFRQACKREGFQPTVFASCSTHSGALLWANIGRAVSIIISAYPSYFESEALCCKPVTGYDLNKQRVFISMNDRQLSPVAETFLSYIAQYHL